MEMVKLLIEHNADINAQGRFGFTLAHWAAWIGEIEVVKLLMKHGANLNIKDNYGNTFLDIADKQGHKHFIKEYSNELLIQTVIGGYREVTEPLKVIESLIKSGADVNYRGTHSGTPLCFAANDGKYEMTKLLIERGANINAKCGGGNTPLHFAAQKEHTAVTKLLTERGANFSITNDDGKTPEDIVKLFEPITDVVSTVAIM
nr:ankyrin repeat domain-containing protein [Wolbachia endosymbiont of Ctenocephalides felis wCfeT]